MPLAAVVVLIVVTVALALLVAGLSAVAAALLAHRAGASWPAAFLRGGVTFGATLTLLALLASTAMEFLR
jgi:hypothetical protein